MLSTITREYAFEAAHFLPRVPEGHKCKRMHGHNYKFLVEVTGEINEAGFVIDFWDLDKVVKPLIDAVDHRTLNDIEGLENPTAEHIAYWFRSKIAEALYEYEGISEVSVKVYETDKCSAQTV
jgi:6-pyruvoyltetrahydropterin/6-carboxytetrahydropterin synthase